MIYLNILFILILIGLNAFFVGVEFAAVASRRSRLDLLADADSRGAQIVRSWLEQPSARDRLIAASQLGITVVSLALGAVGENTFEALLHPLFDHLQLPAWLVFLQSVLPVLPLLLSLIIVTSLHVVLGEQVPKVAVLRAPERFAVRSAPWMQFFARLFKGFVYVLDFLTRTLLKLLGIPSDASLSAYTLEELKEVVTGPEVEGVIEPSERKMLSEVIDFGSLVVRQVSVPRTEIIAVDATAAVAEAIQIAVEHAITKLPVYEENLDQIIGIVHLRDLVCALQAGAGDRSARDYRRDALFVPESLLVNQLLHQMRAARTHLAIVMDEFGGTYGLVTLENLLEEIVGEVQDSFDLAPPQVQSLGEDTFLVDGMTLIEEINEHLQLQLSDPHYDTIAGYVLSKLGRIPMENEEVTDAEQHIALTVASMDRLRIAQVIIRKF